jgi:hypothetical protein
MDQLRFPFAYLYDVLSIVRADRVIDARSALYAARPFIAVIMKLFMILSLQV